MATYKVIQDVEAEDKLLGPLTFRQFVFMGIAGVSVYLMFFSWSNGIPFLIIPLLPFAIVFGFFAFPFGKDQPTELWALARIRFLFKPRKRIWDQSGIKELVTITVPKRPDQIYTDGLSQTEVKSRLRALASTIDSRGWAIKDPTANPYITPALATINSSQDRLISTSNLPQEVSPYGNESYTDMLDPKDNRIAQQFASMLDTNEKTHRAKLVASMQQTNDTSQSSNTQTQDNTAPDYWFLNQDSSSPSDAQVVSPGALNNPTPAATVSPDEEKALVEQLKATESSAARSSVYAHLPTILPLAEQERLAKEAAAKKALEPPQQVDWSATDDQTPDQQPPIQQSTPTVTEQLDPAILNLSRNDDLNIETLARQAKHAHDDDEVVISLH